LFRFQRVTFGSQKTEDRSQKTEVKLIPYFGLPTSVFGIPTPDCTVTN